MVRGLTENSNESGICACSMFWRRGDISRDVLAVSRELAMVEDVSATGENFGELKSK